MDSSESKNNICRVCLDENVALDWKTALPEHDDISYKDCYYKYTQLEQLDDDQLSPMLCKNCANGLEDVHLIILKALDSYNFLLEVNCTKVDLEDINIVEDEASCPSTDFETVLVERLQPKSKMSKQYKYESSEECSIKSEDDGLITTEDDMEYQEIVEVEVEQPESGKSYYFEEIDVEEETCDVYEPARKKSKTTNSIQRRHKEDKGIENSKLMSYNSDSDRGLQRKEMENRQKNLSDAEESLYEEIFDNEDEQADANQDTKIERDDGASTRKSSRFTSDYERLKEEVKLLQNSQTVQRRPKPKRNSQNTPSMCSYCSKILHNKYALRKHEKTHLNRERKAPCPICGVKFLEESYVKIHMNIHNQDREKKHKCEFCDKAFYEKGSLNVHRRIHLGQMIPCTLCSKEFFRQIDLDIHMNSHSENAINASTKKRSRYWVRCKYCDKDIMSTSFKYHNAVHLNEPQMKCSICGREFFRRDSCTEHLKSVHKKTTEEYSNFITLYNKNRLSHLFLEQSTELKK